MPTPAAHDEFYQAQSAVDLTAYMLPQPKLGITEVIKLGTLSMLSVSTHRDKFPVSALSRIGPRGFTAGHRTIAGTLAFATIDHEAFAMVFDRRGGLTTQMISADELPPFNVSIVIVNDYGNASYSVIEDITILDTGVTYSLDSVALMENYSYMARNRTPLQPVTWSDPHSRMAQINEAVRLAVPGGGEPQFTQDGNVWRITRPPKLK